MYIVHTFIINNDFKKAKIILPMLWEAFKLTVPYCTLVIAVFHTCTLQINGLFSRYFLMFSNDFALVSRFVAVIPGELSSIPISLFFTTSAAVMGTNFTRV